MRQLSLVLLLALFTSSLCLGQETWTLEACIYEAIDKNIDMEDSRINLQIFELDYSAAQASRYPNLNGNSSLGWNYGKTIDPTTNNFISETFFSNGYGLNSSVMLYNGGRINNSIKQSEIMRNASAEDLKQMERFIAEQTARIFLSVIFAEENLELARKQLSQSQEQLDQMDKFISAGLRAKNDRIDVEVLHLQNEQMIVTAQNTFAQSVLQLKQLMRIEPNAPIDLVKPENILLDTDPDLITFEEAYSAAASFHPELKAEELRLKGAEIGEQLAKSALYPSISAFGNLQSNYSNQGRILEGFETRREEQIFYIDGNVVEVEFDVDDPIVSKAKYFDQLDDNLSYGFGFGMNVPIYNNNTVKTNIEKSKLNSLASSNNLERTQNNIKVSVQQSLLDARAAKKKLLSSERSLKANEVAYNNGLRKFEIGAVSSFELTSLKTQLESAQIQELIDRYDNIFKTKILEFIMGKPIKL